MLCVEHPLLRRAPAVDISDNPNSRRRWLMPPAPLDKLSTLLHGPPVSSQLPWPFLCANMSLARCTILPCPAWRKPCGGSQAVTLCSPPPCVNLARRHQSVLTALDSVQAPHRHCSGLCSTALRGRFMRAEASQIHAGTLELHGHLGMHAARYLLPKARLQPCNEQHGLRTAVCVRFSGMQRIKDVEQ